MKGGRVGLTLGLALVLGCDAEPGGGGEHDDGPAAWSEQPLVELGEREAWQVLDADHDPLAEHRPAVVDCPPAAWQPELGQLEVQTGVCNYLALSQPSAFDLEAGDRVIVDLWHDDLDAAAPASGHVAVVIDDVVIGEAEVGIPAQAAVYRFEWTVEQPVLAGTPVVLHLHNHGYNSWTFVAIEAQTLE